MDYDPNHPKMTNRRNEPSWFLKYWPLFLFVFAMGGSAMTFYVGIKAVASDVDVLKRMQPFLVKSNVMDLRFRIVENRVGNVDKKVDDNEDRTANQLEKIDKKLEKIQQLLLDNAKKSLN